jgi:hypothetical protein
LNLGLSHARIYAGLHVSHLVSIHVEGLRRRLFNTAAGDRTILFDDAITDNLFIQVGNRTLTKFGLALGRLDMPFGTDHRPQMEIFDLGFRNLNYWNFPDYVANISYDNLVDARIEVAYGSSELSLGGEVEERSERSKRDSAIRREQSREAVAVRASYDLSALEGSRLAFSLYEERDQARRFGISLANRGSNDRKSSLEWVRTGTTHRQDKNFQQLFRLTHATGFRAGNRTLFEFELDHKNYRLVTVGYDKRVVTGMMLRAAASYYWEDSNDDIDNDGLLLSLGLRAAL